MQHSNGTGMLPGAHVVNDDDDDGGDDDDNDDGGDDYDCFPPNEIICLLKLYKLLAAGIFFKA